MFTDGITNKLIGFNLVTEPKDVVMIKVYGANTELMIDRQAEIETMTVCSKYLLVSTKFILILF